jgi:hypothetical protein
MKIKNILKYICMGAFLYLIFLSVSNFWSGFHDIDIAFNALNSGMTFDTTTNGSVLTIPQVYSMGMNKIKFAFEWLGVGTILAVYIGILFRK